MDYFNHPNPKAHNQLLSHNSKRLMKFLLSFSLFCVLFSLLPLILQYLKPFLMQFFSYTIGKSHMFLLCNGLLAFIAMNSGLINAFSPTTHQSIECAVDNEKSSRLEFNVSEIAAPIAGENVLEIESPQEEEKSSMIEEQENILSVSDTQEDDEEEGNALMIIDEDEQEHELGADDTEELNKKFEDFIKKMKAGFCSEPRDEISSYFDNQKSMVAVN
ncbi:uncharacterized protein LOC133290114 [Gastrolobium bilobum]|uniref:uncharacterized protein LOC133290114 n=1 Tax=Gastrolobium bilobum TaxID=150636 RepID=UPI002AB2DFC9|nr:uncharacterized protein LOC133290114 [Gastrolobium bilobum]